MSCFWGCQERDRKFVLFLDSIGIVLVCHVNYCRPDEFLILSAFYEMVIYAMKVYLKLKP